MNILINPSGKKPNNGLFRLSKNLNIDGYLFVQGDYVFIDNGYVAIVRNEDIPRYWKGGYTELYGYEFISHKNPRTKEVSHVLVEDMISVKASILICKAVKEQRKNPSPYNGLKQCQKNDVVRRKSCHPMTHSRNSFDGMIPLSYGEQCISRTFEGRRNSCYNADIM